MLFPTTTLLALVPFFLASSAAPTTEAAAAAYPKKAFGIIASHSGAEQIHLQPVNANGGSFYIAGSKKTSTYCPSEQVQNCPPGNTTAFVTGSGKSLSMSVEVPGGQIVYIDPATGIVHFSTAHSSPPAGSITDGFKTTSISGNQPGQPRFEVEPKGGFLACPAGPANDPYYQVFAAKYVPTSKNTKSCLGFGGVVANVGKQNLQDGVAAWEYA